MQGGGNAQGNSVQASFDCSNLRVGPRIDAICGAAEVRHRAGHLTKRVRIRAERDALEHEVRALKKRRSSASSSSGTCRRAFRFHPPSDSRWARRSDFAPTRTGIVACSSRSSARGRQQSASAAGRRPAAIALVALAHFRLRMGPVLAFWLALHPQDRGRRTLAMQRVHDVAESLRTHYPWTPTATRADPSRTTRIARSRGGGSRHGPEARTRR
jgi:hypothetical protein